jgi:hypothetical protein
MMSLQAMKSWQMKGRRQTAKREGSLPQEVLQSVGSFKPPPNEQTISVKEPELTSRRKIWHRFRLVRSGMSELRDHTSRDLNAKIVKASTVQGLNQEGDQWKQTESTEIRVRLPGRDPAEAEKGISDAVVAD